MLSLLSNGLAVARLARSVFGNSQRRRKGKSRADVNTIRGHTEFVASVTLVSGEYALDVSEVYLLSQDMSALGDLYRYFRFTSLTLEFPAPVWTTAQYLTCLWVPSSQAITPTFANMEANVVMLQSNNSAVGARLKVPQGDLFGQVPWFLTNGKGTDPQLDVQGKFLFRSAVTSGEEIVFKVCLDYEFKELVDTSGLALLQASLSKTSQERSRLQDELGGDLKEERDEKRENSNSSDQGTTSCCLGQKGSFCGVCGSRLV